MKTIRISASKELARERVSLIGKETKKNKRKPAVRVRGEAYDAARDLGKLSF